VFVSCCRAWGALLIALLALLLPGCLGDRCSEGQVLEEGECVPLPPDQAVPDSRVGDLSDQSVPDAQVGDQATADQLPEDSVAPDSPTDTPDAGQDLPPPDTGVDADDLLVDQGGSGD
jgi:hypothetical protein